MDSLLLFDRRSHINQRLSDFPVRRHVLALDSVDGGLANPDRGPDNLLGHSRLAENFDGA